MRSSRCANQGLGELTSGGRRQCISRCMPVTVSAPTETSKSPAVGEHANYTIPPKHARTQPDTSWTNSLPQSIHVGQGLSAAVSACEKHGCWLRAAIRSKSEQHHCLCQGQWQLARVFLARSAAVLHQRLGRSSGLALLVMRCQGCPWPADRINVNAPSGTCEKGQPEINGKWLLELLWSMASDNRQPGTEHDQLQRDISDCEKSVRAYVATSRHARRAGRAEETSFSGGISSCREG